MGAVAVSKAYLWPSKHAHVKMRPDIRGEGDKRAQGAFRAFGRIMNRDTHGSTMRIFRDAVMPSISGFESGGSPTGPSYNSRNNPRGSTRRCLWGMVYGLEESDGGG